MGLDGVEIILAVEETFKIALSDEEAEASEKVGDLYLCILKKMGDGKSTECLSRSAFYQIRWALMNQLNVPRGQIKPDTELEDIIPVHNRIGIWKKLEQISLFTLPGLSRPVWMQWSIGMTGLVIFVGSMALKLDGTFKLMMTVSGVLIPMGIYYLTMPLVVCFPRRHMTVKHLVEIVLQKNYGAIAKAKAKWNEEEVWKALQGIIVEQLGVQPQEVTKETHFVRDLGIG